MRKFTLVLVVEDREDNIRASQKYFGRLEDVYVEFARTYDEGREKLQDKIYSLVMLDLELPRREGLKPERLGFELAEIAGSYGMPWAVITSGFYGHYKSNSSFVQYYWMGIPHRKELERVIERSQEGLDELGRLGFEVLGGEPKTDPRAWGVVYEELMKFTQDSGAEELIEALRRYKERVGKVVINHPAFNFLYK